VFGMVSDTMKGMNMKRITVTDASQIIARIVVEDEEVETTVEAQREWFQGDISIEVIPWCLAHNVTYNEKRCCEHCYDEFVSQEKGWKLPPINDYLV
jgi:hypothetical protein